MCKGWGRGSSATALEFRLPCTSPSICTYSVVPCWRGQFSPKSSQLTPHRLPMRVRCGVSVVILKFDLSSIAVKRNEVPDYFTSFNLHTQGWTHDYNTSHRDDIRTNRVRINLTEKCLRNYLPKTVNSIPNQILNRVDNHSIDGFSSAVKHHSISKYGMKCQNERCYVCLRQPRSWCVNRLLPVNHYVHIPPMIDTLFLTAH